MNSPREDQKPNDDYRIVVLKEPLIVNHFILVGAGGTATYLIPGLHRYLTSNYGKDFLLAIVDGDKVETTNLTRQAHSVDSIGINKAKALVKQYPEQTIAIPRYLSDDNIGKIIQENAVVLITVDNFPCRVRIEKHVQKFKNITVINAGNEKETGSVQIWVRRDGKDISPPLTFLHPEINMEGPDRAAMDCQTIAALPGGGQTALANNMAATLMLHALGLAAKPNPTLPWHEVHFDNAKGLIEPIDYRETRAWKSFSSSDSA